MLCRPPTRNVRLRRRRRAPVNSCWGECHCRGNFAQRGGNMEARYTPDIIFIMIFLPQAPCLACRWHPTFDASDSFVRCSAATETSSGGGRSADALTRFQTLEKG